ncbi:MAG: hypothetical protein N4A53_12000 [Pelagimonas sp.]|nr:hypothetical protein [Pelagimonas sp.]
MGPEDKQRIWKGIQNGTPAEELFPPFDLREMIGPDSNLRPNPNDRFNDAAAVQMADMSNGGGNFVMDAYRLLDQNPQYDLSNMGGIDDVRYIVSRDVAGRKDEASIGTELKRQIDDYLTNLTARDGQGGDVEQAVADLTRKTKLAHQAHKAEQVKRTKRGTWMAELNVRPCGPFG